MTGEKGTEVLMILVNLADWELLSCDGWFYKIISQLMIWTHLIRQTMYLAHTDQDSPTQDLYRLSLFITTVEQLLQAAQYVIITRVLRLTKWQICNCRKKILLGLMMATTSVISYPRFCKFYTRGKTHSFQIIWFRRLHKHADDIVFDLFGSTARKLWETNLMRYQRLMLLDFDGGFTVASYCFDFIFFSDVSVSKSSGCWKVFIIVFF